jgi:hypothetical protein
MALLRTLKINFLKITIILVMEALIDTPFRPFGDILSN